MAASNPRPTTLQLTESETRLRDVLLGVAAYIDASPAAGAKTAVQAPAEVAKEKVVLRWTGGWVRDKLLGVGSHDIDVAINKMTGENFGLKMVEYLKIPGNGKKHGLAEQESKKILSGLHTIKANPEASKNLETATIRIMGIDLDLVNLRKETYNEVSRNPQMEFGTAEEDAMRRDATVNAMFYNLNTKQIEDLTGRGFSDMDAKIMRTPLEPYQTFKDDPLRVLRLIRFASRLKYTIERETASAMANEDIQEALKVKIKRERVGTELEKMLKGPDPHMALELINRFNLYRTIFTDPTRDLGSEPETSVFAPAYDLVKSIVESNNQNSLTVSKLLLRNLDEKYLAWVSAALMPWADAPPAPSSKPSKKRPLHPSVLVAQEGFKAPNAVCNVIASSVDNMEEIKKLVDDFYKGLRNSSGRSVPGEATARDTLGMAIRSWGSTWRSQVLFSLIHEVVSGQVSQDRILSQYSDFLTHLESLNILDADTMKPMVKGTDLAKAMDLKPGPWMKDALEEVMAWQLRNPDITDPAQAIEEVKKNKKGELLSRLISRFLTLTIRPLFLQTDSKHPTDSPLHKPQPWQSLGNAYALDLLRWALETGSETDMKSNFSLFTVPILTMLDDPAPAHKAQACSLATVFIQAVPPPLLKARGYTNLLAHDLLALATYLPTLTPEPDAALLSNHAVPALLALAQTQYDHALLDKIIREAILVPLFHISSPAIYPQLAAVLFSHLATLLDAMKVDSVKHVDAVLPPVLGVLDDPFAPAAPVLLGGAARCVAAVVRNAWVRVGVERVVRISTAVCRAWVACKEYGPSAEVEGVRTELKCAMRVVRARVMAMEDRSVREVWVEEGRKIVEDGSVFRELFVKGEEGEAV